LQMSTNATQVETRNSRTSCVQGEESHALLKE
jgi:hypothetical protein